ncbi:interleukin-2 receptor subunit beta isoform X1 [Simochromis diagramma]|uniref:interleukin-2 receptor subunit beta isoform X1 n=2 Tax=Simochromis diagramma TaxID=43689 RepID=UPI001A7EA581|nr:interleukin-2 receptor subunit beta isoform X1 [Simochromis diagramma]
MSHTTFAAMEVLLCSHLLIVIISVHAAHSHRLSHGLSCANDFYNNVSCTLNSSAVGPGADCWLSGVMTIWTHGSPALYIQKCKLEQHENSLFGCSIVFENKTLNPFKRLNFSVNCNGVLVEALINYRPVDCIIMNPPSAPNVSINGTDLYITWSPGEKISAYLSPLYFHIQTKTSDQDWTEARDFKTPDKELRLALSELKGHGDVRVRVKTEKSGYNGHWSHWSPASSWKVNSSDNLGNNTNSVNGELGERSAYLLSVLKASQFNFFIGNKCSWKKGCIQSASLSRQQSKGQLNMYICACSVCLLSVSEGFSLSSLVKMGLFGTVCFIIVVVLVVYKRCNTRGLLEGKAVPNPSKYFQSLHSVHEGNLKKWLNPLSVSELFFTAQPIDQISPVEVCEDFDVVPSTSPSSSSSSALLHFQNSDTSGIVNNSASSSIFSNRSYFTSSSSGGFACIDPTPAYFTYHDDFHLSFCPSLCGFPTYESLKREPQSPDSGFGIELEADNEEERYMEGGEQFLLDDHNIPFLILPVRFPPHTCPAFSPPTPPSLLVEPQMSSDSHQEDTPMTAASDDSSSAWLVPGAMCRSSSMPVEPGKTGYLTLKELQATFSNKSI